MHLQCVKGYSAERRSTMAGFGRAMGTALGHGVAPEEAGSCSQHSTCRISDGATEIDRARVK